MEKSKITNADYAAAATKIAEIDIAAEKLKKSILESRSQYKVKGTCYFVSPSGCDSNDGLTPLSAWKTPARVDDAPELVPGDVVLFERGCMFRGSNIRCREGVTYSAYGTGPKPVINASPENGAGVNNWKRLAGTQNIWVYRHKLMDVGTIIFDGGVNHGVKHVPDYRNGKYYVRGTDGKIEYKLREQLKRNFDFFQECDRVITNGVPNTGDPKNLGNLYLYCDMGNPGAVFGSIEFSVKKAGFRVGSSHNVTIDNLCIINVGVHGIASGTTKGLTVRNCEFAWIGGTIQFYTKEGRVVRFGNGIEIYGGCEDYVVDHNYIHQCYDAGATHQYSAGGDRDIRMKHTRYSRNLIEYCIYSIEYFLGVPDKDSKAVRTMQDTVIRDNIMRYAGFGFGEQRPDKGSAAHIKGWDHYNNSRDFIVKNNIFDRGRHMLIHMGMYNDDWRPQLQDNVYVQYPDFETSSLGRFGKTPTDLIRYTPNIRSVLAKEKIEKNAEVYFAKKDDICDIPNW